MDSRRDDSSGRAPAGGFVLPESFDGYRLVERLGAGGAGEVWKAQDSFGNAVAFKILRHGEHAGAEEMARFVREGRVLSRLHHPGICRVLEVGLSGGMLFIAMEFVDGVSLARLIGFLADPSTAATVNISRFDPSSFSNFVDAIEATTMTGAPPGAEKMVPVVEKATRVLPLQQSLAIVAKVCDAVQFAHERGVLHRDIKPSNIMMRRDGEPVLMDFGIAKVSGEDRGPVTATGDVFGTIDYMAPEQARSSRRVDERADVYSIGTVLYQLVTGRRHFVRSGNLYRDVRNLESYDPVPPRKYRSDIDTDLEAVMLKALAPDLTRRYRFAGHLHEDLRRYLTGEPVRAKKPTLLYLASKRLARYKLAVGFGGAALILLTAFAGYGTWYRGRTSGQWIEKVSHDFRGGEDGGIVDRRRLAKAVLGVAEGGLRLEASPEPLWLDRCSVAGEVRLSVTITPQASGWSLSMIVNAAADDSVPGDRVPRSYAAVVTDSGGGRGVLMVICGGGPPLDFAGGAVPVAAGAEHVLVLTRADERLTLAVDGTQRLECVDLLPAFARTRAGTGLWCRKGSVVVRRVATEHRSVPEEVTPLVAGDALFSVGAVPEAVRSYGSVAYAYAGARVAESALARACAAACWLPDPSERAETIGEFRGRMTAEFPSSRYGPALEILVRLTAGRSDQYGR